MTSWPEEPPTGQPQTRRQAREFARRAGTAEPTPAGQVPDVTTTVPQRPADDADGAQSTAAPQAEERELAEAPAIPASAFAEPGVSSPSRDAFDLFRQGPDTSRPEPVTQPMAILQTPGQQTAPKSDAAAQGSAPAASAPASPSAPAAFPERTRTRRELRAMQQAQQANAQANQPAGAEEQVFPVSFTSGPEAGSAAGASESSAKTDAASQSAEASTSGSRTERVRATGGRTC